MEQGVFDKFRAIIYRECGIVLPQEKRPLLQNRIQKRLRALKISSDSEYLQIIELDRSGEELIQLVDAISTNVTHFYREPGHFEIFRSIINNLKERKAEIKIWCAAASSGEEPYTIAFEALDIIDVNKVSLRILSTDICTKVLKVAQQGQYSSKVINTIPIHIRDRYMTKISNDAYQVNKSVQNHIVFKKLNLVKIPFPLHGPIDIIFCRNVMIYFDLETRIKIVNEFTRLLSPGGYLFLSHSENLLGIDNNFEKLGSSVFIKP